MVTPPHLVIQEPSTFPFAVVDAQVPGLCALLYCDNSPRQLEAAELGQQRLFVQESRVQSSLEFRNTTGSGKAGGGAGGACARPGGALGPPAGTQHGLWLFQAL